MCSDNTEGHDFVSYWSKAYEWLTLLLHQKNVHCISSLEKNVQIFNNCIERYKYVVGERIHL